MKNKIYLKNWLDYKPYLHQKKTDLYYLRLANQVKECIYNSQPLEIDNYVDDEGINHLACMLTSYFEDIISETNIWNTFVKEHKKLYHSPLPFYDLEDYSENDINIEDLLFLIWYALNTLQEHKFIIPYHESFTEIAHNVFDLFEEEWQYAPENEHLKACYQIDEDEEDYYKVRSFVDNVFFKTYLFITDTKLRFDQLKDDILKSDHNPQEKATLLNETRDSSLHTFATQLLSFSAKEWAVKLLGEKNALSKHIQEISPRVAGFFFYKGQDKDFVFLEHLATGKKFNLYKLSYDYSSSLTQIDNILYIGLVNWKGNWWFSGNEFQIDFNADLVLKERNSVESRQAVEFLNMAEDKPLELIEKQYEAFKTFNQGYPIAFMEVEKIDEFCESFVSYFNDTLNLTDQQKEEAEQRMRKDGLLDIENEKFNFKDDSDLKSGLVFLNPRSGIEIATNVNAAFPLPNNPFFDETESENHILTLLMDEDISTELAKYCIENCKEELDFFNKGLGNLLYDEMDFLMRFWKKENYHSKPHMTFVGERNKE